LVIAEEGLVAGTVIVLGGIEWKLGKVSQVLNAVFLQIDNLSII
jgi:hypothetical protein